MKKLLFIVVLLFQISLFADTFTYPNVSYNGKDVNNPITSIVVKTYPDNASDYNHILVTWHTSLASDSCFWLDVPGTDLSEADVSRKICSSSLVTNHSILVNGIVPAKTYGFYVASCTTGPNCPRTSGNMSSSPYGTSTAQLFTFNTPDTNSSHPLSWIAYFVGPHLGLMQGHQYLLDVNGYKQDGPTANLTIVIDVQVDGQHCTQALGGTTCGTTHFITQPTFGYNTAPNAATHNYYQSLFTTGFHAGQSWSSTAATDFALVHLRLLPDTSATVGVHHISMTLIQADNGANQMGNSETITYDVTVEASPTYSYAAPTTFPAIPSLNKWKANIFGTNVTSGNPIIGAVQNYTNFKIANTTVPGIYNNDNGSASIYTLNPWGFCTYRGCDQVPLTLLDYLAGITTAFQATHVYSYGDFICSNGAGGCTTGSNYVYVVTDSGGCTSGASLSPVTPGNYSTSNTCHFGNIGNTDFWLEMTERTATQQRDYLLSLNQYSVAGEWAAFNNLMYYMRSGDARSLKAIQFLLYPLLDCYPSCDGQVQWQRSEYSAAREPFGLRSLPYDTSNFVAQWLATGTKPVDHGVDEIQYRKDMIIQSLNHLREYSLVDGVNSLFAGNIGWTGFDNHLGMEALREICTVEKLKLGTCDPAIPLTILRTTDWIYSNRFNLLGTNFSEPYLQWAAPFTSTTYNSIQQELNGLGIANYAWIRTYTGDSCTLPTSGATCLLAAQQYESHAFDRGIYAPLSGKIASLLYKDFGNWRNWLDGTWDAYNIAILPANNPLTTFPNLMEPYPQGQWATKPTAIPGSTTAVISWYSYEVPVSIYVKYGLAANNINTTGTCSPASITLVNATTGFYNLACSLSGLSAATTYYYGVGEIDANGNNGYSQYDILLNNHPPFSFVTSGTGSLTCCFPPVLIAGRVGIAYSQTVFAANGATPYTYSITSGAVPGLSINSSTGNIHGTPTLAGTYTPVVHVIDRLGNQANKTYNNFIIQPAPPPSTDRNVKLSGSVKVSGSVVIK